MVTTQAAIELPAALLGEACGVLLVVAAREDVAKRIESSLRNAGHPLRALWVFDLEDLEEVLRRNPPDVLLCDEHVPQAPQQGVIALRDQLRPDLPVILLSHEHSIEDAVAALAASADDLCAYTDLRDLRHLELVVIREFAKHHHLRALRLTQQRLADFQARHQQLAAGTGDAMVNVHEGILANANLAFAQLLGYDSPDELIEQPLIDLIAADQRARVKERLRQVLKGKHNGEPLELAFVGQRGKVHARAHLILGSDNGESVIELLIRAEGGKGKPASSHVALHDRTAFAEALTVMPDDGQSVSSALLARIDGFEALEQRIGHAEAQQVTAQLADAIHARLGGRDQSFVFSIDELSLLIQRDSYGEIEQFAEFLQKELGRQIFHTQHHEAQVTLSVAVYPLAGGEPADAVIAQLVDGARKASAKGGSRIVVVGATAQAHQTERDVAHRAVLVKQALEQNRLKLAYQSIASLEGDERSYFEVLVRMIDESGKEWHAAEFLPAAVKANLMKLVDRWVVKRTLATLSKRSAASESSVLFVKLSEDTLKDADGFLGWLKSELGSKVLHGDEIVFQMQELTIQNHVGKAKILSQSLRNLGAGLAIDHFGIGSSSIPLLDHIPASFVKFHASFTRDLADKNMQKRLGELVEAAKHRAIKTIVSHVEDAHVMARLWQIGVNFVQGHHIQEPEVVLLASEIRTRA
ncbi:MAG: response regulator [Nevskia sp.]|nr:response regulator [Nevskia sp.]